MFFPKFYRKLGVYISDKKKKLFSKLRFLFKKLECVDFLTLFTHHEKTPQNNFSLPKISL